MEHSAMNTSIPATGFLRLPQVLNFVPVRLKEMSRVISDKLRRMGGTMAKQGELEQQALDYIRIAPNREEAFAEAVKDIDMALELSLSRGFGR